MPLLSPSFDFDEFVSKISQMDFVDMKKHCDWECDIIEAITRARVRGAPAARKRGAYTYCNMIVQIGVFLQTGQQPQHVSDTDFLRFRPVALRLRELGFPASLPEPGGNIHGSDNTIQP